MGVVIGLLVMLAGWLFAVVLKIGRELDELRRVLRSTTIRSIPSESSGVEPAVRHTRPLAEAAGPASSIHGDINCTPFHVVGVPCTFCGDDKGPIV